MIKSSGFMFCRSCKLSDNKNRANPYHLTKASHEPPQLYQCAHSFQNPHVCKANFLNVTRKSGKGIKQSIGMYLYVF